MDEFNLGNLLRQRQEKTGRKPKTAARSLERAINDTILNFFDAAGLGIFSVIGVQNTINAGFGENAFFCVFLGMTTGVGGGMLRDVLSRSTSAVLRKHVYALASLAGVLCYYWLQAILSSGSIVISTVLAIVLRLLASHYRWTLPGISS